jgi:uncharacterized repeat protein (TIGR03837 family)
MQWDVFCRVVDNLGDIGVCWRLAADLASRGEQVRLWVDDASALAWMAPTGARGVTVVPWADPLPNTIPGDVVIEAFGCELPAAFVLRMANAVRPPAWINLEYLSAEAYVERSHCLPSPQLSGPGRGLTKWFFYPGFTPATGGLIREPGLMQARQQFDRHTWLQQQTITLGEGERLVSLFSYDNAAQARLVEMLADTPTLLLLTAGVAEPHYLLGRLRIQRLPYLSQTDFDRLLWSCDLNFVRGEDSFVRAQWAGRPFVWQIYPQHDGAHAIKLQAFLERFPPAASLRELWFGWNGLADLPARLPQLAPWQAQCQAWCEQLLAQRDLSTQLMSFVSESR